MNIVHLNLSGGFGGIETLMRDIARISKHNNIFYFLFEGGAIANEIEKTGNLVHYENDKGLSFEKSAKKFLHFCREQEADVIICHTGAPIIRYILSYTKKHYKKAKYLLYLHSNASFNIYPNKTKEIFNRYLIKKAHRSCDKAVAISQSVKDSFVKIYGFNPDKVKVVYNGINYDKFYTDRLNKAEDKLNIVYVGRILSAKGIHVLIGAINLCKNKENIRLTIVGPDDNSYAEKMKERVSSLGLNKIITFTGAKNNIPDILAKNDLFIHPAICEEGFGITLAEAMAAYLPCIAFNKGAIPEIIDNNINGFIVDTADKEHLAEAIDRAYALYGTQEYDNMRKNAHKKAENFRIENVVEKLESLYR